MELVTIVLKNLLGFDLLIFILALFNVGYVLPRMNRYALKLSQHMRPTVYKPIESLLNALRENSGDKSYDLHQIRTLRDRQSFYYHLFISINSLFPLFGILGTVISLLRVSDLSNARIIFNFTTALTSTFWGLIFAIGFKAVDGFVGAKIEENEADFNLLITRIDYITKGDENEA